MRFRISVVAALALAACASREVRNLRVESDRFVFLSDSARATPEEMQEGLARAETLLDRIEELVGAERMPDEPITVRLEGDFQETGPSFDPRGVHLYRYSAAEGGYWALIAHELGHAFRKRWYVRNRVWEWTHYGFYDEGFAEFVAQEIDPGKTGYPFYGRPEDVVVGEILAGGDAVPMADLRRRHEALNEPRKFQAYPQRASWFRYVDEAYGHETMLRLAFPEADPTDARVEAVLGTPLAEVDRAWRARVADRVRRSR